MIDANGQRIDRYKLVAGWSMLRIGCLGVWTLLICILSLLAVAAVMFQRDAIPAEAFALLTWIVGAVAAVATVVALVVHTWFYVRKAQELRAGYTTGRGMAQEFPQVDPDSGFVIRRAGAPFLSREEWLAACAEARTKAGITGRERAFDGT